MNYAVYQIKLIESIENWKNNALSFVKILFHTLGYCNPDVMMT